ncbi:MAG TPA: SDR family oxidoreductase [Acidothermaceae bacterium]|jgi:UDP-glucose 4-epimerase
MKMLITGSRGFLGQALGAAAAARGHELIGLSRSAQPAAGWQGAHHCVDVVDDDLTDIVAKYEPDAVIHAAGPASVGDSFLSPVPNLRTGLMSWANVLDAVRRTGIPARAVLLSSAAVYGQPATLPVAETAPAQPLSPYGYAKAMAETLGQQYASCFGIDVLACRLFSVLGPGQRRLLIWEIYRQLSSADTDEVVLTGSSSSSRDYLHVDDVAVAVVSLCEITRNPGVVNIASGDRSTVGQAASDVVAAAASDKAVRFLDKQTTGDPDHWQADISTLRALLPQWQPRTLAAAVAACVAAWSTT